MEKYEFKNKANINLSNIVFAVTSEVYYEMERLILLENLPDLSPSDYVLVEGYHCSCYDFDETKWEGTIYRKEELQKLLEKCQEWDTLKFKLKEFLNDYWR